MDIDDNNDPKMSFNNTNTFGQNLFVTPPAFSGNQNPSQNKIFEEKPFMKMGNNIKKKYSEKKVMRSFYVYYALKVYKFIYFYFNNIGICNFGFKLCNCY